MTEYKYLLLPTVALSYSRRQLHVSTRRHRRLHIKHVSLHCILSNFSKINQLHTISTNTKCRNVKIMVDIIRTNQIVHYLLYNVKHCTLCKILRIQSPEIVAVFTMIELSKCHKETRITLIVTRSFSKCYNNLHVPLDCSHWCHTRKTELHIKANTFIGWFMLLQKWVQKINVHNDWEQLIRTYLCFWSYTPNLKATTGTAFQSWPVIIP